MKKFISIVSLFIFITINSLGNNAKIFSIKNGQLFTDTLPDICIIVPPKLLDSLNPFGVTISSSFPDELNYDTYKGCFYQFFTNNMKPQIAVRLMKFTTKKEAAEAYKISIDGHTSDWYGRPERISLIADSAYFNYEGEDTAKCDECGLVALQGIYVIYVSFKGAYDETSRSRKKFIALKVLEAMYDNYDLLLPRIRNRQN